MSVVRGDALRLPVRDGAVQCCVTSPPYFALRDYRGVASSWPAVAYSPMPGLPALEIPAMECQLGHESRVEAFVGHLVAVFRRVREALHESGTLWLNLGDTYDGSRCGPQGASGQKRERSTVHTFERSPASGRPGNRLGVPWRVAFALQADGWILRSPIVWAKPAPMPESLSGWSWRRCRVKVGAAPRGNGRGELHGHPRPARVSEPGLGGQGYAAASWADCPGCEKCEMNGGHVLRRGSWRPTSSHEMLFLLAKSERYFCDAEAAREPTTGNAGSRGAGTYRKGGIGRGWYEGPREPVAERNPRDVWTIGSAPLAEDHFAAFPPGLVERCVLAGTPAAGVCSACGEPWAPACASGWLPCCGCSAPPRPAIVLDPFGGSGTTARVASQLGRSGVSLDVEVGYCAMARARVDDVVLERRERRVRRAMTATGPLFS